MGRFSNSTLLFLILGAAFLLSGVNRCQEDVYINFGNVPTATPTDGGDDDGTTTATPTETPEDTNETSTATPTPTPTSTPTATPSPTVTTSEASLVVAIKKSSGQAALEELSSLSLANGDVESTSQSSTAGTTGPSNWLGKAFSGANGQSEVEWQDQDVDGFSDSLEILVSSDPTDRNSYPLPNTALVDRLPQLKSIPKSEWGVVEISKVLGVEGVQYDSNGDGIFDALKIALGLDPMATDSDEDGISDSTELILGSDPAIYDPIAP